MALPEGGEADYRRPWRLPKGEWAGTFMRRRRSLDAVRAVVLLLLLALGCPHHVETPALPAETWFPLGRSELAPWSRRERDSWRDAMLAQDTFAMDAALDRQGRVWVATLEPDLDGARLRIRVRDGDAWTVLPDVRLPSIRDGVVSLTTDAADRPVVAWLLCHADAHGVRVSDDGRFVVFNGQTTSHDTTYISIWSEADASWTHIAGPTDWEIGGNIAYGEMGIDGSTVWAPANGSDGVEGGIVEADIDAATSTFTALSDGYIQTFLGFDGWLYAQGTTTAWNIDVYDPGTLVLDRSFRFPHLSDPRSFAIAVDGTIYAADWDGAVVRYDAMGTEEARLSVGVGDPVSIDLSTDGRIVVGGRFGEIAITDTTLGSVSALSLTSYVTFVDWIAP